MRTDPADEEVHFTFSKSVFTNHPVSVAGNIKDHPVRPSAQQICLWKGELDITWSLPIGQFTFTQPFIERKIASRLFILIIPDRAFLYKMNAHTNIR